LEDFMAVLLDLDGTLTDPREGILACFRYALERLQRVAPSDAVLERLIGPPLQDGFRTLLRTTDPATVAAAVACYRERFTTRGMYENAVYPGILEALARLRARGLVLLVATSKPTVYAEQIVEHFGLREYFAAVYGSELDGRDATKTDLLAHIVQDAHLDPAQSVMIGDRSHDMLGARANRIRPLGVLWGYGSAAELTAAGAERLLTHPSELGNVDC
jgi:phosphoglycolate phosphatase